jgi:hypothetical protein
MKHVVMLFLGLLSLSFSALLNASTCGKLIRSIDHDINQAGESIQTIRLPWMNIYWLKKRLGSPRVTNPHATDETLLQYSWSCPEGEIFMTAIANKEGLITEVHGQYSSDQEAEYFSAILPQNTAIPATAPAPAASPPKAPLPPPPIEQPKPVEKPVILPVTKPAEKPALPATNPVAIKPVEEDPLTKLLNPYNENFQLSLKTKDELFNDMMQKIKNFYKNMRSCTPGIYRYAVYLQSGFIFPVTTIDGKKNGLCKVDTLFAVPTVGTVNAKCLYKLKSLEVYTDAEAEMLVKGKSFDKTHPSLRDKVEAAACETYINDKLQPKLV